MSPHIFGVIGPGFPDQVSTLPSSVRHSAASMGAKATCKRPTRPKSPVPSFQDRLGLSGSTPGFAAGLRIQRKAGRYVCWLTY